MDEEKESILGFAITEIRQRLSSDSPEIIVPFKPDILIDKVKYTVPRQVRSKSCLNWQNGMPSIISWNRRKRGWNILRRRTGKNLEKLKNDLHMPEFRCILNASTIQISWEQILLQHVLFSGTQDQAKRITAILTLKQLPVLMIFHQWKRLYSEDIGE